MCIDFNLRYAGCLHTFCDVNALQEWCSSQGKGLLATSSASSLSWRRPTNRRRCPASGSNIFTYVPPPPPSPPRLRLPDITDKLATLCPHVFLQCNVVNFVLGLDTSIWCDATSQSIQRRQWKMGIENGAGRRNRFICRSGFWA